MIKNSLTFGNGLIIPNVTFINSIERVHLLPESVFDFMIFAHSKDCFQGDTVKIEFIGDICTIECPIIILTINTNTNEIELSFNMNMTVESTINLTVAAKQLFDKLTFKEPFYICPEFNKRFYGEDAANHYNKQVQFNKLINTMPDDLFHEA